METLLLIRRFYERGPQIIDCVRVGQPHPTQRGGVNSAAPTIYRETSSVIVTLQNCHGTVTVVVVLTIPRIIKSVVTGQAAVTLELTNTPEKRQKNQRWYTHISHHPLQQTLLPHTCCESRIQYPPFAHNRLCALSF